MTCFPLLRLAAAWLTLLPALAAATPVVSLDSLLAEMLDVAAPARWPQPQYTCRQASSYDRASIAPDQPGWFANNDQNQFIRTESTHGRSEQVMLDAEGPGCLVRFWLTTDHNKQGTLRIYLDGAADPALAFPAYDLLSGDLGIGPPLAQPHPGYRPDGNGGNNLYLPSPYARHCKVTWQEAGSGSRFYQINYRTYPPGTALRTFSRAELDAARPGIARANKTLDAPPDAPPGQALAMTLDLAAGGTRALNLPPGPAALRRLELRVPAACCERALRSLVVQMECDAERTIWCPASDFFGCGVGLNALRSWYRTVRTDGTLVCRWVMPYRKDARLSLTNLAGTPLMLSLTANTGPWQWDERSMHFHAAWHHQAGLRTPPPSDWNFVTIAGRGVYVGDTLAIFNPLATWYGEGDEKIRVDGETFPSHMGTGTEDYYGYSYAPKPVHQTPFSGEPRLDQPMTQGHSTSTRTRNLDGIPFCHALQFDMELIAWKPTTLTYAATTYWYALPGATSTVAPQPRAAAAAIPTLAETLAAAALASHRPGAIECERMPVLTKSADFFVGDQDMEAFGGERWSGGHQLLGKATAAGAVVELAIPAPDAAPRKLVLHATQAPDYATLRFHVNGQAAAAGLDGYAEAVQPAPAVVLGVFTPRADKFILRIEVAGANPAARGAKFFFGLDCVVLDNP